MTEAEVLALINAAIVANGNNEITANVLRPILVAMLEQPNDKVGELVDLDTTDKSNIVNAINELLNTASTTFEIHSGANNPNTTPPASYSIGDWYIRSGSSLYQFNGDAWILLSSSGTISDTEHFLATEGQTVFTLSTTPANVDVWVNDVYQQLTYAYTFSGVTVTLLNASTAGDRVVIRKYEQNISGAISKAPIQDTYANLAALIAAQASQLTGYIYEVTDGSGFSGIDSGKLWVRYLGTVLGTEADYSWEPRTSGGGSASNLQKEVTDTYSLASGDNNYTIWFNKATDFIVTINNDLSDNFECSFINKGIGIVTFVAGTATLVTPSGSDLLQNSIASLIKDQANNSYWLKGELD